jgi:RNA polymerase sigma factor (sigma-70 family)
VREQGDSHAEERDLEPELEAPFSDLGDCYVDLFVRAFRVAGRVLRDDREAEDVAAETMARATGSWKKVRTYSVPWVTRVAANLAIDALRRRRSLGQAAKSFPADPTDRIVLLVALKRLPTRQREAVVLRYVVDLSQAETAEAMGVSAKTVKTHLQRGIAALRGDFSEELKGITHGT